MTTSELVWVVLRSTGLVALVALTLSVASGLTGPAVRHPAARGVLIAVHRSMAVAGLALTLAHVLLAVFDSWVQVPAIAAVVPLASPWRTWGVACGAVAFDLLVLVAITSGVRGRGPRVWWSVHMFTYAAWLFSAAHAISVGTDTNGLAFRAAGVVGIAIVAGAALLRAAAVSRGAPVGVPPRPGTARGGFSRVTPVRSLAGAREARGAHT